MSQAVLLVDDEALLTMALKVELKGFLPPAVQVKTAASGPEALEVLDDLAEAGVRLALLISDGLMTPMGGPELLTLVHQRQPDAALCLMSGNGDLVERPDLPHTYLGKPWDSADLRRLVLSALGTSI